MTSLKGHHAAVTYLGFHPKVPEALVSTSYDGTCRLWDAAGNAAPQMVLKPGDNFGDGSNTSVIVLMEEEEEDRGEEVEEEVRTGGEGAQLPRVGSTTEPGPSTAPFNATSQGPRTRAAAAAESAAAAAQRAQRQQAHRESNSGVSEEVMLVLGWGDRFLVWCIRFMG